MKTYIIICAFADKIAGGPIYNANKVRYMKEKGWNVVVVRTDVGTRAAIPGLEEYFKNFLPEAGYIPTEFTKCQREKLLKILLSTVLSFKFRLTWHDCCSVSALPQKCYL